MQSQIQYVGVELRQRITVPEELCGVHDQEAAGCFQEGGESHQVLARGAVHTMSPFQGQNHISEETV